LELGRTAQHCCLTDIRASENRPQLRECSGGSVVIDAHSPTES
jgi:hypothetical protein